MKIPWSTGWQTATALLLLAFLGLGNRSRDVVTDRDTYNQGTQKLNEGDYRGAEMLLFPAVLGNDPSVQPAALYNLGLARFALGAEMLEEGPSARAAGSRAVNASQQADVAMSESLNAMQQREQNALLRAYLRGRGARRELKEAMKALTEALDVHADVLGRWQRASGDFHSTVELHPADLDAAHNAEVTDRHIARLIDSIRQMQMMMEGMSEQMDGLEQLLEEMKGMIPDDFGDPGPGEDGEEDWPEGPEAGMEESRGRDGTEFPISPEDARRLLEAFQLDRDRKLPMGFEETSDPEKRDEGRNW